MSGPLSLKSLADEITILKETVVGDGLGSAVSELISNMFDRATKKTHHYKAAHELLEASGDIDRFFNVLSLGNWLFIANRSEVRTVPARIVGVARSVALFSDAMGNQRPPEYRAELEALDDGIQTIKDDEMLRFDPCGSSALKQTISEGYGTIKGESRGYIRSHNGRIDHILCERLADAFLWHPEDMMPVFARPIIKAKTREGWTFHTGLPGIWPIEWRVYVKNGAVVGVSNYYPQSVAETQEVNSAMEAVRLTERLMLTMSDLHIIPHHPRYEETLDVTKASFSVDYIETDTEGLLLLEGGPAHIYSPPFGASPCCFNPHEGVNGVALGPGIVLPLAFSHTDNN